MSERVCGRGCVARARHNPNCMGGDCPGCLPILAAEGAMLCPRCMARLKEALTDAPDICALLRSMIDPLGAQSFEPTYGTKAPFAPAPVRADLLDAGDDILKTLIWWAQYYGDTSNYKRWVDGVAPGATPEKVRRVVKWAADFLLFNMDEIKNDSFVVMMSRKILDWPDDWGEWTIQKARSRFPLYPTVHWAPTPCPHCGVRSVRVTPARIEGEQTGYVCRKCAWEPPAGEIDSWAEYLEGAR